MRARTLADLVSADGELIVPAGTVGEVRRVIPQPGMEYPDLEVVYANGVVEVSPVDSFEPA